MKALARIVAEADGRGGTRLSTLYGEPPLLPRQTGPTEVHLVGGAAGPLGGDDLHLEVAVGPGATLVLRTVAATLALPGPGPSHTRMTASVQGRLVWLPEPIIAARGCYHVAESVVELGPAASLVWREEVVCGRHREEGGDLTVTTTVRRDGRTLHRQDLAVGPRAPAWAGAAVLGDARAAGCLLMVDPDRPPDCPAPETGPGFACATMPLIGPGTITTAVARDAHTLRAVLSQRMAAPNPAA